MGLAEATARAGEPHPDESVGPLERGFTVLREIAKAPDGRLRSSELTRVTGLARSTVDRVAATLVELGYLRAEGDGRDLVLAPPAARLGDAYLRAGGLPTLLAAPAEELSALLDESVSLAVPDRESIRFIIQVRRHRALSVAFRVGDALPAERCAPGAIFAQHWTEEQFAEWAARVERDPEYDAFPALPTHRARQDAVAGFAERVEQARGAGWSEDDQLIEQGLLALAVPVYDGEGRAVCALSVVSHASRQSIDSLRETVLGPALDTAARMSERVAAADRAAASAGPAARTATPTAAGPAERLEESAAPSDPTAAAKEQFGPGYLQSLARGISVLSALGADGRGLTLAEAAAATGLPRATARRSLLTAVRQGYAAGADGRFSILPRVFELGYARLRRLTLGEIAAPHLRRLVAAVHESASTAVLDGEEIRYVARAAAHRIMSVDIMVGTRFPAFATSMGRVLLADLPEPARRRFLEDARLAPLTTRTVTGIEELLGILNGVANEGYALVDQELEQGLRSIAVPVRGPAGTVVAALNVSMHAGRTSPEQATSVVLPELRAAASAIAEDLALLTGPAA